MIKKNKESIIGENYQLNDLEHQVKKQLENGRVEKSEQRDNPFNYYLDSETGDTLKNVMSTEKK